MTKRDNFLLPDHARLLNIATWSSVLAWLVLAVYILGAGAEILRFQRDVISIQPFEVTTTSDYVLLLSRMATGIFRGFVYFVVLRAVALGLIVIVETSLNSNEQEEGDHE